MLAQEPEQGENHRHLQPVPVLSGRVSIQHLTVRTPLERDRPPWTQLAIHSYYAQEPVLKRWVRELKGALASGPP